MSSLSIAAPYRETLGDRAQAFIFALGVHLLALLLMFAGVLFSSSPEDQPLAGEPIEAVLIDLPRGPPPKPARITPNPAPTKPVAAPPPAPKPAASLDDVTDIKPIPVTAEPDPLAQVAEQEKERQRKLDEQRRLQLQEIREQREAAERERLKLEKELAAQQQKPERTMEQLLQDRTATGSRPNPVDAEEEASLRGEVDTDDLAAQWQSALVNHIRSYWRTDGRTPDGLRCNVRINSIPGGEVVSSMILSPCAFSEDLRQSLLDAIQAASPLPYTGFESVAQRTITMTFDTTFIE